MFSNYGTPYGFYSNFISASLLYNSAQVILELLPVPVLLRVPELELLQELVLVPLLVAAQQDSVPFQDLRLLPGAIRKVSFEHRKDSPRRQ
jgi:hypothetical protein